MKLTKSGEPVEFCCEYMKASYTGGEDKQFQDLFNFKVRNGEPILFQCDLDCFEIPLNFCPNCGAKTEIEGGER